MRKIFQDGNKFYFVQVFEDGTMELKVKENGWSDIWSLPLTEVEI